jgi:RNA polymerase sigma-70 factor (ECF subfamily)
VDADRWKKKLEPWPEYRQDYAALHRYAWRLLGGDAERAADVVQEACLRLVRGARPLQGPGARRRWLFVVVRNLCLSQLRHGARWRMQSIEDVAEPHAQGPDPARACAAGERSRQVAEAVARLPLELREVLILREYEEMNYEAIAEIVGIPLGTVRSRLARAREALRRSLRPLWEELK